MPSAEERFQAKIVRRGAHQVWTGSQDRRGVGMVRIDGRLKTVQRAAWEFAHGLLEPGSRVNTWARTPTTRIIEPPPSGQARAATRH